MLPSSVCTRDQEIKCGASFHLHRQEVRGVRGRHGGVPGLDRGYPGLQEGQRDPKENENVDDNNFCNLRPAATGGGRDQTQLGEHELRWHCRAWGGRGRGLRGWRWRRTRTKITRRMRLKKAEEGTSRPNTRLSSMSLREVGSSIRTILSKEIFEHQKF